MPIDLKKVADLLEKGLHPRSQEVWRSDVEPHTGPLLQAISDEFAIHTGGSHLELRGYAHGPPRSARGGRRSRHDARFAATGLAVVGMGLAARVAGVGSFDPYPVIRADADAATLALAAFLPLAAAIPFAFARRRRSP